MAIQYAHMSNRARWYAIYTRSRFEKRTYHFLREKGVEVYLPLVKRWRIWSDRKKQVEIPLVPSYLFVRTVAENHHTYFDILNTPGVVRFICFEGKAVSIPENQIDTLKRLNGEGVDMACLRSCPPPGSPVRIIHGPMKGLEGEVISVGKNKNLILRLNALDKCINLKIPLAMAEVGMV
ncbi:MAG: UpxY family transcription antiterminator [Bacteroidia bacterium]|nr:MAG: UpxY family transcription antiterminator [Bacteroidia bacterium]